MSANNSSQTKNSTNILISSITKTSKGKDSKNASKNIKTTITKKKNYFLIFRDYLLKKST